MTMLVNRTNIETIDIIHMNDKSFKSDLQWKVLISFVSKVQRYRLYKTQREAENFVLHNFSEFTNVPIFV